MLLRFLFSIVFRLAWSWAIIIGVFSIFSSAELDLNRSPPSSDESTVTPEAMSKINEVDRAQIPQESMNISNMNVPRKARDSVRKKRLYQALQKIKKEKVKEKISKRSESRRRNILLMTDDQKEIHFQKKRGQERQQYQTRKLRRGYGRKSNDYLKQLRQKVKNKQATPQEIAHLEKVRSQDRQKYHRRKARLALSSEKDS